MSIKDELVAIREANDDGILHCHEVVDWARENTDSALHSAIEWDDETAADAHRLWQVRRLIEIHVIHSGEEAKVVSLSIDRKAGGGYRSLSDVVSKPDLREIMLKDALDELERVQAKYSRIKALESVWEQADAVRARSGLRRRRPVQQDNSATAMAG